MIFWFFVQVRCELVGWMEVGEWEGSNTIGVWYMVLVTGGVDGLFWKVGLVVKTA